MSTTIKRITALIPAAVLSIGLLAACGLAEPGETPPGQPSSEQSAQEEPTGQEEQPAEQAEKQPTESEDGVVAQDPIPDDGLPRYAASVQAWSPYLEVWTVDGSSITHTKTDCTGSDEETTGTLDGSRITWDGDNPMTGSGKNATTSVEMTEETFGQVGSRDTATTDLEGQREAHVEKCVEAGETVGKIVFG